jgi:son of sevenless-like protein
LYTLTLLELKALSSLVRQIQVCVQSIISQVTSFLSLIADIHVARHVDIDGIRQGGDGINDHYSLSVETARRLVRSLEATLQAVYDDGAALFFTAQGLHEDDCNRPLGELEAQIDLLENLSTSFSKNLDHIKQDIEALLSVGHEQADIAQGDYNGSIDWRMSRISAIDGRLNGVHNHTKPFESDNEDVVDMELALHPPDTRKPKSSLDTSSDSHRTLATAESAPPAPPLVQPDVSNDTLVAPSTEEYQGDDGTLSLFEEEGIFNLVRSLSHIERLCSTSQTGKTSGLEQITKTAR